MKYNKPQIMDVSRAIIAVHSGQQKIPCYCVESQGSLYFITPPAYEADEH
jgi:hypothetical protein